MRSFVWIPDGAVPPGRLTEVDIPVLERGERHLVLPGVAVSDVQPGRLFASDDLRFDHARGGGPLATGSARLSARAFGLANVAYHLQRGLDEIAGLLGRTLPPLIARIGMHGDERGWGGAHYRLPAQGYTELPEPHSVAATGEIHFSAGNRYVLWRGERYFHTPAHNPGIIYHELGHHLCRHTADFRLNGRRPPDLQANRKIPLDEGTSDYLAAVLMGTPDIFGWQRADVPADHPERRRLDGRWTMRHYRGSSQNDPHIEGTVWSSTLWATRCAVQKDGIPGRVFDRVVLRALDRVGSWDSDLGWDHALRRRRHFSRMMEAMLEVDGEQRSRCRRHIEAVFADRGIFPGRSNRALRDAAREAALRVPAR